MKTKFFLLLLGATVALIPSLARAQTSQSKAVKPTAIRGTPIGVGANGTPISPLDVSFKPADFAWLDNVAYLGDLRSVGWSYTPDSVLSTVSAMDIQGEFNYFTILEGGPKNPFFRWQKQYQEIGEARKYLYENVDVNRPGQTAAKLNDLKFRQAVVTAKVMNRLLLLLTVNLDDKGRFSKIKLAPYEIWASDQINAELKKASPQQKKSPQNLAKIRFVNRILLERMLMQSRWNSSLEGYADYVDLSPFEKRISVRKP